MCPSTGNERNNKMLQASIKTNPVFSEGLTETKELLYTHGQGIQYKNPRGYKQAIEIKHFKRKKKSGR